MDALRDALWRKGYHLFHYGIHRVCVAPIHPLATRLYDPRRPLGAEYTVPYVDLYEMFRHAFTSKWNIEQSKHGRKVLDEKVQPFAQVTLLGMEMDTLADPIAFLQAEYGAEESYLTPENWAWA